MRVARSVTKDELGAAFNDGIEDVEKNASTPGLVHITLYTGQDKEKNQALTDMWCAGARYAHLVISLNQLIEGKR